MAFELISSNINKLIDRRVIHDVTIERRLYSHSTARITIDWDEVLLAGNQQQRTVNIGAAALNADLTLTWKGSDLHASVECFQGYVAGVTARHTATRSYLVLDCISKSKRADIIPRYRVWQDCTLLDICEHVAGSEPLFRVQPEAQGVLGGIEIDLSVQFEETDFDYLGRMLHAWGIPMYIDDRANRIGIGKPDIRGAGAFPALTWHCDEVVLEGSLVPVDDHSRGSGAGPIGVAKQRVNDFNQQLSRSGAGYQPRLDDDHLQEREWISERVYDSVFHAHAAVYRLLWNGAVFDYSPGTGVSFDGNPFLVRSSIIRGDHQSEAVTQEFILQDYMAPLQLHRRRVQWPSRTFWATVVDNEKDPTMQGRIQVEFDWEKLDSKVSKRFWVPTVTPYGGLKGSGSTGLLCLPEIGERVLVQFLGDWDNDAVVLGSVREYARDGFPYDPHETKRLQTPSGNQVTLTTRKDGTDIVRIKCQDKTMVEGKIASGKQTLIFDLFDSEGERIHFEKGGGPPRLDVFCSGEIYMHAGQKLLLEGGMVQIKSTTGPINIDGGPMVMINCGPWSLDPLKLTPEKGPDASPNPRKRAKPPKWTAMVTAAGGTAAAASATQEQKQHFIEFVLKDKKTGEPIPDERYRVKLPDGTTREGRTDANGRVRVEGIPAGQGQISYPDIDADSWDSV